MATLLLLAMVSFSAGVPAAGFDLIRYEGRAVELLQRYFRIDTSNPPGNERRTADFFRDLFAKEKIECRVFDVASGRANVYARLRGNGAKRPIILLNHMDVVNCDPKDWSVPPFSGEIRKGVIYGRGAEDMKSEGMLQAMVMIALKDAALPLQRDVIFLAVADEEVGALGSTWMIEHKRDLLAGTEYLINEGGENLTENGKVRFWEVNVAEKAPFWLRLRAHGQAGHGSRPMKDSAPNRLTRTLARVVEYETPLRVLPIAQRYFCDRARLLMPEDVDKFCNLEESRRDPAFRNRITSNPDWNYMLRNTMSLTVMKGGPQTNVIPSEAVAELDIRLLPGEDPEKFLAEIRRVIADDQIQIEKIGDFRLANSSPTDNLLWQTIQRVIARHYPETVVTPVLAGGYTESQMYRQLGINSYGFCPFVTTPEESNTSHGVDERITIANYKNGLKVLYEVIRDIAGPQP
jgi:acetylornithine deacetylase/succinyl-diaminopimelate desuccinylase-like protein